MLNSDSEPTDSQIARGLGALQRGVAGAALGRSIIGGKMGAAIGGVMGAIAGGVAGNNKPVELPVIIFGKNYRRYQNHKSKTLRTTSNFTFGCIIFYLKRFYQPNPLYKHNNKY